MPQPTQEQREAWDLAQIHQRRSRLVAKPIGSVVRRLLASSGYAETQGVAQLLEQWQQAVGPELAKLSRPGNVARGILQIHVANSAVMQEVHFRKKQILTALQKVGSTSMITELKIRVDKWNAE
ncbi:MAG: DUF721 domain-containing protein [Aureliella sp.]